jgi:hypothetical protein
MEIQIIDDVKQRIIDCHNGINGSMKQALEYAFEAGRLLTEVKESLNHGEFLPWIEKNIPFSSDTTNRYIKLYNYQNKIRTVRNLQEAYKQIETFEKQEKESEQQKALRRIQEYKKTGVKPDGWRRGTDDKLYQDDIDYQKRMAERQSQFKNRQEQEEERRSERDKFFESAKIGTDLLNEAAEMFIQKESKRKTFKEKIKLSQDGEKEPFIDAIMDYLDELENDNRRIEACQNIIKVCKRIAVDLQKG